MTPTAVARLVSRIFSASARDFGQSHLEVYAEALENVDDEVGDLASRQLVNFVSWDNPPSVKMVKDQVNAILARQDTGLPALVEENDPVVADPETNLAGIEAAMAALRRHQRLPSAEAHGHQPDVPEPAHMKLDAHSFGDHSLCGPNCPERPIEAPTPAREGADA